MRGDVAREVARQVLEHLGDAFRRLVPEQFGGIERHTAADRADQILQALIAACVVHP